MAEQKDCCPTDDTKSDGCCPTDGPGDKSCCPPVVSSSAEQQDQKEGVLKIEVVGPGCASCHQLHEIVKKIAPELELKNEVLYLSGQEGMQRMMQLGMMQAPILLVDGKVAMVGYNPSTQKIKNAILEAAAQQ